MFRWIRPMTALSVALLVGMIARASGDRAAEAADLVAPRVAGTWSYEAMRLTGTLSGAAVECSVFGLTMTLTQSASTFAGSAAGGTMTCRAAGQRVVDSIGTVIVAHGMIDGSRVAFDLGSPDWRSAGALSVDRMSGSLPLTVRLADQDVVLHGAWSATRRPGPGWQEDGSSPP